MGLNDDNTSSGYYNSSIFSPSRLEFARMRRGMKQTDLANNVGMDHTTVCRYEKGERQPDYVAVLAFADCLGFPPSFFYQPDIQLIGQEGVSFRSRRSEVRQATRDRTLASLTSASLFFEKEVRRRFHLPSVDLPSITGVPPHLAASRLRSEWGLGVLPISNLVHLLEAKGIRVYWFEEDDPSVDAVCKVEESIPYAMLSQRKRSGERMRFDLAHELGHLVMHRGATDLAIKDIEDEANAFASAFLMPEEQFRLECPNSPTMVHLINMKPRWGVSLQAIVYRCFRLGIYSEFQHKNTFQKINANGWRFNEPGELAEEKSKVWEHVFEHLKKNNISVDKFAASMHLGVGEVYNLIPHLRDKSALSYEEMSLHYLTLDEMGYEYPNTGHDYENK